MTIVSCKESRIESPRSFYACFSLGPFEESMSLTVANALRRTLLTECTGIAIVNVLFENVNHEYATLVGVRETVLDILLNIKEIVLKKQTNPISQLLNPKTHIPSSTFPFSRKEGCFAEGSGALKSPRAGIEPSGIEGAPNSAAPARPIPKPFRLGGSYAWGSSLVFPLKTKYSQTILSFKGLGAPSPNLGLGAPEKNQGRAPSPKLGLGAPNPLSLGQTKGTARRPEPLRRGSAQISVLPLVGRGLVGRPRPTRGRPTSPWSVQGSPVFPIGTGALCPPGLPRRPALCQSGLPIGAGALGHPSQGKDQAKEECADRRHLRCFTDREARKGKGNKTIKGQTKKILGKAKTTLYNKVYSFFPVVAYLRMKGPGIIRAKHLRLPPFVQCVDPEQYITTLSEDGILNMKCIIMEGKGYIIQKSKTNKNYLLGSSHSKAAGGIAPSLSGDDLRPETMKAGHGKDQPQHMLSPEQLVLAALQPSSPLLSTTSLYQNTLNEERSLLEKKNIKNQILLFEYLKNIYSKKILVPSTSENKVDFLLKNSYLNVDAVFSPVTKVSYIIELNENRLMKKAKIKEQFIHDIFTLLDSHLFLQKKLPFLTKLIPTVINPFKNSTTNKAFANIVGVKKRNKSRTINEMGKCMSSRGQMPDAFGTVSASLHADLPAAELNIDSSSFGENAYPFEKQIVPILTLLNNFNTGNIITLEIWTNGSLHPKEALATAFSTLATLFLNMKKTNIYNSIYKDSVSYQKSLTKPLTNQSAYVQRHPLFEVGSEGVSSLSVTAPRVSGFLKGPSPAKMPKVSAVLRAGPNIVRQPFILTSCGLPPRGPGAAIEPQDVRMKGCLPAAFQPNVYGPSPKTTYKSAQEIRKLLFSPDPRRGKKQSFRNSCSFTQPVLSSLSTNSTLIKKNDIDISFLNLNMRAYTILKRANIKTVSILSKITVVELFEKYKLDKQTIQNIKNSLNALNYLF